MATLDRVAACRACARVLLEGQPSTIVDHEVESAAAVYRRLVRAAIEEAQGKPLASWGDSFTLTMALADLAPLADSLEAARLRSVILGADDSQHELETNDVEAPDAFVRSPAGLWLRQKRNSIAELVDDFLARGAITREVWDRLADAEKRHAFTVARQSSASLIRRLQLVVARGIAEGEGSKVVSRWLRALAPDLAKAHAETVYRNAVQGAYAKGRGEHMTQPHVVAARPFWQTLAVRDSRTRKTHQGVNGWVMRAGDSGWQATYPPYGHRCRCRVVARSARWVESNGPTIHSGALPNLPDRGWITTPPPMIAPIAA
jgi:SPP1 gp7 family putative phage head morphogenesis protein